MVGRAGFSMPLASPLSKMESQKTSPLLMLSILKAVCWVQGKSKVVPAHLLFLQSSFLPLASTGVRNLAWNSGFRPSGAAEDPFDLLVPADLYDCALVARRDNDGVIGRVMVDAVDVRPVPAGADAHDVADLSDLSSLARSSAVTVWPAWVASILRHTAP